MQKGQVFSFMKRLFKLRNIPAFITILVAILGGIGVINPNTQSLLAVIAFLAIDSVIERISLLTNIECGVLGIQKTLNPQIKARDFFRKRGDFERMEIILNKANQEIWVSGLSLGTIATIKGHVNGKLSEGCNILLLCFDPNGQESSAVVKTRCGDQIYRK